MIEKNIQEKFPECLKHFRNNNKQLIYEFGLYRVVKDNGLSEYLNESTLENLEASLKSSYNLKPVEYGNFRPF